jgi:hypothetical protein
MERATGLTWFQLALLDRGGIIRAFAAPGKPLAYRLGASAAATLMLHCEGTTIYVRSRSCLPGLPRVPAGVVHENRG